MIACLHEILQGFGYWQFLGIGGGGFCQFFDVGWLGKCIYGGNDGKLRCGLHLFLACEFVVICDQLFFGGAAGAFSDIVDISAAALDYFSIV